MSEPNFTMDENLTSLFNDKSDEGKEPAPPVGLGVVDEREAARRAAEAEAKQAAEFGGGDDIPTDGIRPSNEPGDPRNQEVIELDKVAEFKRQLAIRLAGGKMDDGLKETIHTVVLNEEGNAVQTLRAIARIYKITPASIVKVNFLNNPRHLVRGQELLIRYRG